jgi:4-hydroxy-4-methyl-2-oxoglutarate aldolase
VNIVHTKVRRPPAEVTSAFAGLDVATVGEVMQGDGLMDPDIRPLIMSSKLVGPAITALNRPGDNLAMHVALHFSEPGDVMVTSSGAQPQNALWGEQVTLFARHRGLAGVVTDGAVRDTEPIREIGLPVWSRLIFARRSSKSQEVAVNVPIPCGGVMVNPGDIILADDDGVLVVPLEEAEAVLKAAEERKLKERERRPRLMEGRSVYELFQLEDELRRMGATIIEEPYERSGRESRPGVPS